MISTLRLDCKLVILSIAARFASNRDLASFFEAWAQSLVQQNFCLDNVVPKEKKQFDGLPNPACRFP
jgi:hypothetical protein